MIKGGKHSKNEQRKEDLYEKKLKVVLDPSGTQGLSPHWTRTSV